MKTDGHDVSRFAPRGTLPPIDHEANGPLSTLVRVLVWFMNRRTVHAH